MTNVGRLQPIACFEPSFMDEYGVHIFCGDYIDLFGCVLDFCGWGFEISL